jgi:hypothetical protein
MHRIASSGSRTGWTLVSSASLMLLSAALFAQDSGGARQVAGLLLLPALALAGGALQPVLAVLFPRWTASTRDAVEERRGLCLLWGFLIALVVFIVLVLCSGRATWLASIAALLLLVAGLTSLAGYVGVAAAFGSRLVRPDLTGEDRTPLQALAGGLVLCFSCLVPVVGQVLALALVFASIGAGAVALLRPGAVSSTSTGAHKASEV